MCGRDRARSDLIRAKISRFKGNCGQSSSGKLWPTSSRLSPGQVWCIPGRSRSNLEPMPGSTWPKSGELGRLGAKLRRSRAMFGRSRPQTRSNPGRHVALILANFSAQGWSKLPTPGLFRGELAGVEVEVGRSLADVVRIRPISTGLGHTSAELDPESASSDRARNWASIGRRRYSGVYLQLRALRAPSRGEFPAARAEGRLWIESGWVLCSL